MEKCEYYINLLEKLLGDEISKQENEILLSHIKSCKDCAEIYHAHELMLNSASPFNHINEIDLQKMRRSVLNSIKSKHTKSPSNIYRKYAEYIQSFFKRPELVFAAVALIIGFFFGRMLPPDESGFTSGIVRQINNIAKKNIHFTDTQNSSYRFSNVSMKELDGQKISMSFDVSTHLDIVREKNDPLVKEILAQTLMNQENLGSRLKAISYSETILDDKIKDALMFSMQHAPLPAIRLKAMSSLMKYENDAEIQQAFVKVLKEESSIKMNLMAIDYLTGSDFNVDSLRSVLSEIDPQKSTAVFVRAKEYLENN